MPQNAAMLAAAHGVARHSRPSSPACNDSRLGSRRPPSPTGRLDGPHEGVVYGQPLGRNQQKTSVSKHDSAATVGGSDENERVTDPAGEDRATIEGPGSPANASEEQQYPHFFAWINMQKKKQAQAAKKQQQGLQTPQFNGTNSNSRPSSACSKQRPSAAAKQAWQPSNSPTGSKSATASGMQSNSRPASASIGQQRQQRRYSRPSSAVPAQRQEQQPMHSRPQSAMGWFPASTPTTGQYNIAQQQAPTAPIGSAVPTWLVERNAQVAEAPAAAAARPPSPPPPAPARRSQSPSGSGLRRPDSPTWESIHQDNTLSSSRPASPAFDSIPEARSQQQQQLHTTNEQLAVQLFQQLPLPDGAPVDRHTLQQLLVGLQCELARLGPPISLQVPDFTIDGQLSAEAWSAHEQVAPEMQVWDKLTNELCRQTRVESAQRGVLLLTAVTRQRQLLHMALSACDGMYSKMQEVAEGAQQLHRTIYNLQMGLEHAQRQKLQLEATLQAEQQKLAAMSQELQQQQDRMRKGRYHLITEEVQIVKQEIEQRWIEHLSDQLQQVKAQCATEYAASRQQLQDRLLRMVAETAGDAVANSIKARMPADQTASSSDSSCVGLDSV